MNTSSHVALALDERSATFCELCQHKGAEIGSIDAAMLAELTGEDLSPDCRWVLLGFANVIAAMTFVISLGRALSDAESLALVFDNFGRPKLVLPTRSNRAFVLFPKLYGIGVEL